MVVPRVLHPLQGVLPVHVDKNHTQDGQHEEAEQYKNESEGYLRHGSMRLARCRHDAAPKRVQIGCHKRSREAGGGAKARSEHLQSHAHHLLDGSRGVFAGQLAHGLLGRPLREAEHDQRGERLVARLVVGPAGTACEVSSPVSLPLSSTMISAPS